MTEYRTIRIGCFDYLQYKVTRLSGWWIFRSIRTEWVNIRSTYYDYFDEQWEQWEKEHGQYEGLRRIDRYINSYNTSIDDFVKRYPVIESYLIERARIVKQKRSEAHKYHREIDSKAGQIKYFK